MTTHSCWVNRQAIVLDARHAWECGDCGHRWFVGEPAQPETKLGTPPWARPTPPRSFEWWR
jgi:hypothetical protein